MRLWGRSNLLKGYQISKIATPVNWRTDEKVVISPKCIQRRGEGNVPTTMQGFRSPTKGVTMHYHICIYSCIWDFIPYRLCLISCDWRLLCCSIEVFVCVSTSGVLLIMYILFMLRNETYICLISFWVIKVFPLFIICCCYCYCYYWWGLWDLRCGSVRKGFNFHLISKKQRDYLLTFYGLWIWFVIYEMDDHEMNKSCPYFTTW